MMIIAVLLVVGILGVYVWQGSMKDTPPAQREDAGNAHTLQHITPQEAHALIQEHADDPDFIILDVRTPQETAQAKIAHSKNINFYSKTFQDELQKLDKEKPI